MSYILNMSSPKLFRTPILNTLQRLNDVYILDKLNIESVCNNQHAYMRDRSVENESHDVVRYS